MAGERQGVIGRLTGLMQAARKNRGRESIHPMLRTASWAALAEVLEQRTISAGELLVRQGEKDRNLYFIESGVVRIYRTDSNEKRLQLAVLGPGSIIGEGTFFAPIVRNASAEAAEATVIWELQRDRFIEVAKLYPEAAVEILFCIGAVLSIRMLSVAGRLAIT